MWRFCCGAEEMHLRAFRLGLAVIGIELLLGILVENTAGVLGALITILSVVVQLLYGIGFIYIYVSLANGDEVGWSHFTEKAELIGKYFLGGYSLWLGSRCWSCSFDNSWNIYSRYLRFLAIYSYRKL